MKSQLLSVAEVAASTTLPVDALGLAVRDVGPPWPKDFSLPKRVPARGAAAPSFT
jgi:hypothetical protein